MNTKIKLKTVYICAAPLRPPPAYLGNTRGTRLWWSRFMFMPTERMKFVEDKEHKHGTHKRYWAVV